MNNQRELLERELDAVVAECTECGVCVKQCGFLQRFGTPSALAQRFRNGALDVETLYSCSLCSLCDAVCPERLSPSTMFRLMRTEMVEQGRAPLRRHRRILAYERRGLSNLFELYAIPEGATSVFFPGCALAGTRPAQTLQLFERLREDIPDLGMVLSCCAKPSHDLGRAGFFATVFAKQMDSLTRHGVDTIITACPSCHQIFKTYGTSCNVRTVYELLAEGGGLPRLAAPAAATIHDPCATRYEDGLHHAARRLAAAIGFDITEMRHRGKRTCCCGEGGSACFVAPRITGLWAETRKAEAAGLPVITYCAGCVEFFSKHFRTVHLIDLVLDPERAMAGDIKIGRSPFTYLNRLRLKWTVRRIIQR